MLSDVVLNDYKKISPGNQQVPGYFIFKPDTFILALQSPATQVRWLREWQLILHSIRMAKS